MGIMDSLLGHGASNPDWMKQGTRSAIDDYRKYMEMMWSPQSVRGRVGNYTGNYDRSMGQYQQAGNAQMGMRGMRGTPQAALRRSGDIASFADQAQMQAYQGMMGGQQGLMGMYGQAQPFHYRPASGGLVGQLGGLAGQLGAAGVDFGGNKGGGGQQNPNVYGLYGPMTQTQQTVPYNYDESGVNPFGQYAAMSQLPTGLKYRG
jgi:hypothetical protein